ncbi:unnamed protein product [Medioppia subpectinata]|uniref:DNA-repair protein Xrcc1 N-terminal domain-containing protein n=1 Tax=Medioppia subpectinata TaxID=1979941 RepID=A0A7R9QCL8_9ACAR|nr:unnamed protein product [Medioppia subpectinata]CAG2118451.1 unnamed protein product [Medioppia subpectinata]
MPEITFAKIIGFSSEDSANHLYAHNLLKSKDFKSWKCDEWQTSSYVILETNDDHKVDNIEIGNDGSAFVEVFVANAGTALSDPNKQLKYQVLLSTSSFMTPSDSKLQANCQRIRQFPNEKLSPNARNEKWNRFKIVCTQPFNKTIPFGLAFVRFNTRPEVDEEMDITPGSSALNIGPFRLRSAANDDPESDRNSQTTKASKLRNT